MGFPDSSDQNLCSRFHSALPKDRAQLIDQFTKPEFKILAERILCRNAPSESLSASLDAFQHRTEHYIWEGQEPLIDYKGEAQGNYREVLTEITKIRSVNNLDEEQGQLLDELEQQIKSGLKPR